MACPNPPLAPRCVAARRKDWTCTEEAPSPDNRWSAPTTAAPYPGAATTPESQRCCRSALGAVVQRNMRHTRRLTGPWHRPELGQTTTPPPPTTGGTTSATLHLHLRRTHGPLLSPGLPGPGRGQAHGGRPPHKPPAQTQRQPTLPGLPPWLQCPKSQSQGERAVRRMGDAGDPWRGPTLDTEGD